MLNHQNTSWRDFQNTEVYVNFPALVQTVAQTGKNWPYPPTQRGRTPGNETDGAPYSERLALVAGEVLAHGVALSSMGAQRRILSGIMLLWPYADCGIWAI